MCWAREGDGEGDGGDAVGSGASNADAYGSNLRVAIGFVVGLAVLRPNLSLGRIRSVSGSRFGAHDEESALADCVSWNVW